MLNRMQDELSADEGSEENAAAWVDYFTFHHLLHTYPEHAALLRIFNPQQNDEQLSLILAHRFFNATDTQPENLPEAIKSFLAY